MLALVTAQNVPPTQTVLTVIPISISKNQNVIPATLTVPLVPALKKILVFLVRRIFIISNQNFNAKHHVMVDFMLQKIHCVSPVRLVVIVVQDLFRMIVSTVSWDTFWIGVGRNV